MAYIWLNHKAHIFLDTFGLLLGNQKEMRRYRIKVYKDVLKTAIKTRRNIPGLPAWKRIQIIKEKTHASNHPGCRNGKTFKAADTE